MVVDIFPAKLKAIWPRAGLCDDGGGVRCWLESHRWLQQSGSLHVDLFLEVVAGWQSVSFYLSTLLCTLPWVWECFHQSCRNACPTVVLEISLRSKWNLYQTAHWKQLQKSFSGVHSSGGLFTSTQKGIAASTDPCLATGTPNHLQQESALSRQPAGNELIEVSKTIPLFLVIMQNSRHSREWLNGRERDSLVHSGPLQCPEK